MSTVIMNRESRKRGAVKSPQENGITKTRKSERSKQESRNRGAIFSSPLLSFFAFSLFRVFVFVFSSESNHAIHVRIPSSRRRRGCCAVHRRRAASGLAVAGAVDRTQAEAVSRSVGLARRIPPDRRGFAECLYERFLDGYPQPSRLSAARRRAQHPRCISA